MSKRLTPLIVLLGLAGGCAGEIGDEGAPGPGGTPGPGMSPGNGMPAVPFEAQPGRFAAAKVKDLLTGLPLEDAELQAVAGGATPQVMRGLVDKWMQHPNFREKLMAFFKNAFQQTQLDPTDLDDQLSLTSAGANQTDQRRMLRSVEESFARTAMAIFDENRPFTETVTTSRFMLNVPMMMALAYMDAAPRNDTGGAQTAGYWLLDKFGRTTFKYTQTTNTDPATGVSTPIPLEETINPASPNFMKWQYVQPDPARYMPCMDPITVTGTNAINSVFRALFGARQSCQGAPAMPSLFTDEDWNTWRPITIRAPRQGEERTIFWELPKFRDPRTTELVLATPRVGFFTTLAFFANWPTNPSNSYRVTLNQALIVALGRSFDDRSTVVQVAETSVDSQHVQPGTVCFGCHQTLDPMRDFFKQSYSMTYFQQLSTLNPRNPPLPAEGVFSLDGSPPVRGVGVATLARGIAEHPSFAPAWVQKLCQVANAAPCKYDDPEFLRLATAFASSKFNLRTLIRELHASPLVTYSARTKTAETDGVVMSIARRDAFCARLSARLGVKDLCNLQAESGLTRIAAQARNLSLGIPGSAYSRADENPVTPHDPNLFFSSATEKICMAVAGQLVESGPTAVWKVAARDAAIADWIKGIMGVPVLDPMYPRLYEMLERHYQAAIAAKETPAESLRSVFTAACSSPFAVSLGL